MSRALLDDRFLFPSIKGIICTMFSGFAIQLNRFFEQPEART
jgi:hypothetical protein